MRWVAETPSLTRVTDSLAVDRARPKQTLLVVPKSHEEQNRARSYYVPDGRWCRQRQNKKHRTILGYLQQQGKGQRIPYRSSHSCNFSGNKGILTLSASHKKLSKAFDLTLALTAKSISVLQGIDHKVLFSAASKSLRDSFSFPFH